MSPKKTCHSVGNSRLWQQIYGLIGKQAEIRVQEPTKSIILPHETIAIPGFRDIYLDLSPIFPKS